jgi:hypothetical protein
MPGVIPVNSSKYLFDISRNLTVTTRASKPGAPERIDGMTIGVRLRGGHTGLAPGRPVIDWVGESIPGHLTRRCSGQ